MSAEAVEFHRQMATYNIDKSQLACSATQRGAVTGFWMVSKCSQDYDVDEIVNRCQTPSDDDLYSGIPVTVYDTIHFKNVFCAVCNWVLPSNISAWDVVYDCPKWATNDLGRIIASLNLSQILDCTHSLCSYLVSPPGPSDDSKMISRECQLGVINQCSDDVSHHAFTACRDYSAIVYLNSTEEGDLFFRNPHCILCNSNPNYQSLVTSYPLQCNSRFFAGYGGRYEMTGREENAAGIPFSVLFDFGAQSNVRVLIKENGFNAYSGRATCKNNEVFDIYTGICRTVSCPADFILQGNRCVPKISHEKSAVHIRLVFENNLTMNWSHDFQICMAHLFPNSLLSDIIDFSSGEFSQVTSRVVEGVLPPGSSYMEVQKYLDQRLLLEISPVSNEDAESMCDLTSAEIYWPSVVGRDHNSSCDDGEWIRQDLIHTTDGDNNNSSATYINETDGWYPSEDIMFKVSYNVRQSSDEKKAFVKSQFVKLCRRNSSSIINNCASISLPISYFEIFHRNGSRWLRLLRTRDEFSPFEYRMVNAEIVQICSERVSDVDDPRGSIPDGFFPYSRIQTLLSISGNVVSIVASALTVCTYCLFSDLRKRGGVLIMWFVIALTVSQLFFVVGGFFTHTPLLCSLLAVADHYAWLSAFAFMNVIAYDLSCTFGSPNKAKLFAIQRKRYCFYFLYGVGVPSFVVVPCVVIHICKCVPFYFTYGDSAACWIRDGFANLVMFGGPVGVLLLLNYLLYVKTITGIRVSKSQSTTARLGQKTALAAAMTELMIYLKVSVLK